MVMSTTNEEAFVMTQARVVLARWAGIWKNRHSLHSSDKRGLEVGSYQVALGKSCVATDDKSLKQCSAVRVSDTKHVGYPRQSSVCYARPDVK